MKRSKKQFLCLIFSIFILMIFGNISSLASDQTDYEYDGNNQLLHINKNSTGIVQFTYDDNGKLIGREKITPSYPAWDINQDGIVDLLDIDLLRQHYGETGEPGWIREDVNQDGIVDLTDLVLVANHMS